MCAGASKDYSTVLSQVLPCLLACSLAHLLTCLVHNEAKIIHRDIKPENLLIDEFDNLKIADFGVSAIFEQENDELTSQVGTKYFQAPEVWTSTTFQGRATDVWALGVTLYFLSLGQLPFRKANQADLKDAIVN